MANLFNGPSSAFTEDLRACDRLSEAPVFGMFRPSS
jgi:hypothetical protein